MQVNTKAIMVEVKVARSPPSPNPRVPESPSPRWVRACVRALVRAVVLTKADVLQ